ncbi:ankyrin [Hypoxylon sp. EC38]|nr:ankyrin [Hypoxylon sp. EC38]
MSNNSTDTSSLDSLTSSAQESGDVDPMALELFAINTPPASESDQDAILSTPARSCNERKKLSDDLIYDIASYLASRADIGTLRQTCRRNFVLLETAHFQVDVRNIIEEERDKHYQSSCVDYDDRFNYRDFVDQNFSEDCEFCYWKNELHERPCGNQGTWSALHWASSCGFSRIVGEIIRIATQVDRRYLDAKTYSGRTALSLAAEKGHIEIIRQLINAGVFVDAPEDSIAMVYNPDSPFPKIPCTSKRSYLRDLRGSVNPLSPLCFALVCRQEEAAILLAHHSFRNMGHMLFEDVSCPLIVTTIMKMPNIMRILLSQLYGLRTVGRFQPSRRTILIMILERAIRIEHNYEVIDILIDELEDPHARDNLDYDGVVERAICLQRYGNAWHIIQHILQGKDKKRTGSLLGDMLGCMARNDMELPMVKELSEELYTRGHFLYLQQALCTSFLYDDVRQRGDGRKFLANFLVSQVSHNPGVGTYLHWLFSRRTVDVNALEYVLLEARDNININAMNAKEFTPLDIAIRHGHKEAAAILKAHGAIAGKGSDGI